MVLLIGAQYVSGVLHPALQKVKQQLTNNLLAKQVLPTEAVLPLQNYKVCELQATVTKSCLIMIY